MKCFCHQSHKQKNVYHFDRILKITKNYRFTRSSENSLKAITVKIQRVIIVKDVKNRVSSVMKFNELIPMKNLTEYLLKSEIQINLLHIHLFYS